jgi:hypothetical protein
MFTTKRSGSSAAMRSHRVRAKALAVGQSSFPLGLASGVTTCRPFPPVVLQKAMRPTSSSRSRTSRAAAMTSSNVTSGAGSRSKISRRASRVREGGSSRGGIRSRRSGRGPPGPRAGHLDIGLVVAEDLDLRQQVRRASPRMTLKEPFALDAVGSANDRAWPPLDVAHHPGRDGLQILRQFQLGDGSGLSAELGHSGLSGLEMVTPITTESPARFFAEGLGVGSDSSASAGGTGVSATTSLASLSSRRPLNDAWRTFPSPVKPAN